MRRLLPLLLLALVAAGCSNGASAGPSGVVAPSGAAPTPAPARSYVALGDSYTAAPYVPLSDLALGCVRSDHNYPHLLAKQLHARLSDVSCSAARIADLTSRQQTFRGQTVAPQLRALKPSTDLVTLGIGGNDDGLFGTLVGACPLTAPGVAMTPPSGTRCGAVDVPSATHAIADIHTRLVGALGTIHRRAPHAKVVLIGYPRIVSTTTTCPKLLPVSRSDAVVIDRLTKQLDTAMRAAAKATHTSYVDLYRASAGHDACSATPWVNGVHTDTARAAALHPFAVEQQAVARLVAAVVS